MKQVTLKIADSKFTAFLEFIKTLDYVKIEDSEEPEGSEEVLQGITQGFKEVKLIEEGKLKGTPLKDFLNEL